MIVVDTNVIAYLYLPNDFTPLAERLRQPFVCEQHENAPEQHRRRTERHATDG